MAEGYLRTFPLLWDINFIMESLTAAEVVNHFGYEINLPGAEYRLRVKLDDAETLDTILDGYETDYLAVLRPRLKDEVQKIRTARRNAFTFQGMAIPLDEITMNRLAGMAIGLTVTPEAEVVDWDIGVLNFISFPREVAFALGKAAFQYVQADFTYSKVIGAALDAAVDITEAQAIFDDMVWPT